MCACVCLVFYICMYMDMDLHTNLGIKMFKKIEFQARGGRCKWGNFKNGGEDQKNLKRKEKKRKITPTSCVYI